MGLTGPMFTQFRLGLMAAAALVSATPAVAQTAAPSASTALQAALALQATGDLQSFYFYREQPLWWQQDGSLNTAAIALVELLRTSQYDGFGPDQFGLGEIEAAVAQAQATREQADIVKAELALTTALVNYAAATSRPVGSAMMYEHDVLRPMEAGAQTVLYDAGRAVSLEDFVANMRWMHPLYAQVRRGLLTAEPAAPLVSAAEASLQRLRSVPAPTWSRHVLIDIPSARLWMYEGGVPVDSMRIVVGKIEHQTPQMAGYLRYATLNPYWNVPDHLIRETIAPNVIRQGVTYLRTRGYEILKDWSENPEVLDPTKLDWQAIKAGTMQVRVRQKPRDDNSMGDVKFEFPNPEGIYLHDTPLKQYMKQNVRQLSNGCVRLEDAMRFGQWLTGAPLPVAGATPEQKIVLAEPVPIFITYMSVNPGEGQLALGTDPYRLDLAPPPANIARAN
jgi:murein L,D-transpeptidase YcbB/YkuD